MYRKEPSTDSIQCEHRPLVVDARCGNTIESVCMLTVTVSIRKGSHGEISWSDRRMRSQLYEAQGGIAGRDPNSLYFCTRIFLN